MKKIDIHKIIEKGIRSTVGEREAYGIARIYSEDKIFEKGISVEHQVNLDIDKIIKGVPVQYIVGKAYFYSGFYYVDKSTLIPRPETEELVHFVFEKMRNAPGRILDVGTGTGCIAIELKKKYPNASIVGLDVSAEAIKVAQKNRELHQVIVDFHTIDFLYENNWGSLGSFDLIISNPPYIALEEKSSMSESTLLYEPRQALIPNGEDTDIFYRKLAKFALTYLKENGSLLVEINEFRLEETELIFSGAGFSVVLVKEDMQGKPRMMYISK